MTQFPDSAVSTQALDPLEPLRHRTSLLAVAGLVIGIFGCLTACVPLFGPAAMVFGGLGIFAVTRSQGRLTGIGLAVAGTIMGLLSTVVSIAFLLGANTIFSTYNTQVFAPTAQVFTGLESGDFVKARSLMTRSVDTYVTDDMLRDFTKRYQAKVGNFQSTPSSLSTGFQMLLRTRPAQDVLQSLISTQGTPLEPRYPLVFAKFSKDTAVIAVFMPPNQNPITPGGSLKMLNLGVLSNDGSQIWLLEPAEAKKLEAQP